MVKTTSQRLFFALALILLNLSSGWSAGASLAVAHCESQSSTGMSMSMNAVDEHDHSAMMQQADSTKASLNDCCCDDTSSCLLSQCTVTAGALAATLTATTPQLSAFPDSENASLLTSSLKQDIRPPITA